MLLENCQKPNLRITEGLCAALLAKFLSVADEIVKYLRACGVIIGR